MSSWLWPKLTLVLAFLAATGQHSLACQCGGGSYARSLWDRAKDESESASVIFEGVPQRFDLKWDFINSPEGTIVSCNNSRNSERGWGFNDPHMVITFRILRSYKGNPGDEVTLNTGFGGGDCGAVFSTGLTYLVYASGGDATHLLVGMCSPGGWIGDATIATNLRYLRKERPLPVDLSHPQAITPRTWAVGEKERRRNFQERQKHFDTVTGRICGTVIPGNGKGTAAESISFLSTEGYSPFDHPTALVNDDGSFCSERLGPGAYYLFFTKTFDGRFVSASYYPGVTSRALAKAITVAAGMDKSDIFFHVPEQKTYSVRGFISTDERSGPGPGDIAISLVSPAMERMGIYTQTVDFAGWLPLPKTKYFSFDDVLPGRYIVLIRVGGGGWTTKKVELDVTNHDKLIFLEIAHKNSSQN